MSLNVEYPTTYPWQVSLNVEYPTTYPWQVSLNVEYPTTYPRQVFLDAEYLEVGTATGCHHIASQQFEGGRLPCTVLAQETKTLPLWNPQTEVVDTDDTAIPLEQVDQNHRVVVLWNRERNVLFKDALNTFYLRLYGVRHMVKDHSDSEKGNPLPPHRLLFLISSRGALAGTKNSSMGPPYEGSIRQPIAPWANALTMELHLAPLLNS